MNYDYQAIKSMADEIRRRNKDKQDPIINLNYIHHYNLYVYVWGCLYKIDSISGMQNVRMGVNEFPKVQIELVKEYSNGAINFDRRSANHRHDLFLR